MAVTVSGKTFEVNGVATQFRGINVYCDAGGNDDGLGQWGTGGVLSLFKGINFARLNSFNYPSAAFLLPLITQLTAAGVVCEIEDHNYPTCLTGTALTNAANWYHSLASAFAGNGLVVFGTQNEPDLSSGWGAVDTEITTIIEAIRGAGNNNLVLMCAAGGYTTSGLTASKYSGFQNIAWDLHFYNWLANNSTNLSDNVNALDTEVANAEATLNIAVAIMEYGISSGALGAVNDPGGNQVVQAVEQSGLSSAAWAYTSGNPTFPLLLNSPSGNPAGGLTAFGQTTAAFIAKNVAPPAPPPPTPPSSAATFIQPGVGSFTVGGHLYTLSPSGQFTVDGTPIPSGNGTCAMATQAGVVYGQDANTLFWYIWNGSTFTQTSTPPAFPPLAAPPVTAQVDVEVWNQQSAPGKLQIPVTLQ